ncbi:hypothetical protein LX36DRAFT_349723 [Colletotrichum falcatum]|nr:hypothetical protein LX36DRAFT_349723 [Colletotrichum falcatum]
MPSHGGGVPVHYQTTYSHRRLRSGHGRDHGGGDGLHKAVSNDGAGCFEEEEEGDGRESRTGLPRRGPWMLSPVCLGCVCTSPGAPTGTTCLLTGEHWHLSTAARRMLKGCQANVPAGQGRPYKTWQMLEPVLCALGCLPRSLLYGYLPR